MAATYGVSQWTKDLSLCISFSPCICLSIKKKKRLKKKGSFTQQPSSQPLSLAQPFPLTLPQALVYLLSLLVLFCFISGTLHKWDYIWYNPGNLNSFTWDNAFKTHVVACTNNISLIFLNGWLVSHWWIQYSLFIYSPIEGHLDLFQNLFSMSKAILYILCRFILAYKFSFLFG